MLMYILANRLITQRIQRPPGYHSVNGIPGALNDTCHLAMRLNWGQVQIETFSAPAGCKGDPVEMSQFVPVPN